VFTFYVELDEFKKTIMINPAIPARNGVGSDFGVTWGKNARNENINSNASS